MKLEITRASFYKNVGGVMKSASVGEIIECSLETAFEIIGAMKAVPADYPDPISLEILSDFDTSFPNYGAVSARRADKISLPRAISTILVFDRKAQPCDSNLWTPSYRLPPPEPRNFVDEREAV